MIHSSSDITEICFSDLSLRFSQLLSELGVTAVADDHFKSLSKSDKRKVCIVVAILAAMDVIVLEEPTRDLTLEDSNKVSIGRFGSFLSF